MRQIEQMWTLNVQDGKNYFLMEEENGQIRTGICHASVTTRGRAFINDTCVDFSMTSGDLKLGKMEHVVYMAEID